MSLTRKNHLHCNIFFSTETRIVSCIATFVYIAQIHMTHILFQACFPDDTGVRTWEFVWGKMSDDTRVGVCPRDNIRACACYPHAAVIKLEFLSTDTFLSMQKRVPLHLKPSVSYCRDVPLKTLGTILPSYLRLVIQVVLNWLPHNAEKRFSSGSCRRVVTVFL